MTITYGSKSRDAIDKAKNLRRPVLSIRLLVFTVSPNKQYRGILHPTTPATTGP